MLLSLSKLQSLHFWQAGLTDQMLISLLNTISLCSNLRAVTLEGNPLPERSYHLLLSEDSILTHLSLRNNRIGDEGARLIGSALSTTRSANKNLLSLNLAFNCIGDEGAAHIAKGLRFNCALLFLSLSNNQIGDSGAGHLAATLAEFALTHEEVVERRKLLLERTQDSSLRVSSDQSSVGQLPSVPSSTSLSASKGENKAKKKEASKKEEKPAANKENPKSNKKSPDIKVPQSKGGKQGSKEKLTAQEDKPTTALNEQVEAVEIVNPLLDRLVQYRDGELILPGNTTLSSLNLEVRLVAGAGAGWSLDLTNMADKSCNIRHIRPVLKRNNRYEPLASGNASFSAAAISSPTCHSQKTCCTHPLRRRRGGTRRSVLFRVPTLTSWM
ncbi:Leucine-rich repeat-containing protein 71 [Larimichthys crocea]|uniref:Uncharacterized protein n=1 Tax=Larimichthys crocea TaxID=215358 RepID=A0ACD3RGI0_LARCR|nr:Leucine-rich repeat-containing protein 71 [Larimichthys crocea]